MAPLSLSQYFSSSKTEKMPTTEEDHTEPTSSTLSSFLGASNKKKAASPSSNKSVFSTHTRGFTGASVFSSSEDEGSFWNGALSDDSSTSEDPEKAVTETILAEGGQDATRVYFESMSNRFRQYWNKKSVRFEFEETTVHETPPMTDEECEAYWYDRTTLQFLRAQANLDAKAAFHKEAAHTLLRAYKQACRAKSEDAMNQVGKSMKESREAMRLVYYEGDGQGLEKCVTNRVRGDSKGLCTFVLDQIRFHTERDDSLTVETKEKLMAHISQCISRPSRLLSYQLALAQEGGDTLYSPEEMLSLQRQ